MNLVFFSRTLKSHVFPPWAFIEIAVWVSKQRVTEQALQTLTARSLRQAGHRCLAHVDLQWAANQ